MRATLYRLSDRDHLLTLTAHHLVVDGWSLGVFLKELAAFYESFAAGRGTRLNELPLQYADFAVWQHAWLASPAAERQLAYWKDRFAELPPALDLPTDRPRSAEPRYRPASEQCELSAALQAKLEQLSRDEQATLFMTLLASFQALLSRYTGKPISASARRRPTARESSWSRSSAISSTRCRCGPTCRASRPFGNYWPGLRETTLGALANQELPLDRLIDALRPERELGQSPLFQAMFVFENVDWRQVECSGLSIGDVRVEHRAISSFDLTLIVEPQVAGLSATLVYNSELFDRATMTQMLAAWRTLVTGAAAEPDGSIARLPLLSPHEQNSLTIEWNRTECEFPSDRTIHELFVEQAAKRPDAIAVISGDKQLTYGEFDRRTNQLARYLSALGVGPEIPVGLCFDRSIEMLVALIAVLKAGGAYVPLDLNDAPERLELIADDMELPVILTQRAGATKLPAHKAEEVLLDADWPSIARESDGPLDERAGPERLAYVIYTSGSTGRPKGVEITHRSLVNHATEMVRRYRSGVGDRLLQLVNLGFDAAGEEIFPALISGATLVLADASSEPCSRQILDDSRRHGVTIMHVPTVLWHQCIADWTPADDEIFKHLRVMLVGGEAPSVEMLKRWRQLSGSRERFLHAYGLTEATITSTLFELAPGEKLNGFAGRLPIGRPIANTTTYVLDAQRQPVPVGGARRIVYRRHRAHARLPPRRQPQRAAIHRQPVRRHARLVSAAHRRPRANEGRRQFGILGPRRPPDQTARLPH